MKNTIFLLLLILLLVPAVRGQIEFLNQPYDFGMLSDEGGYIDVPVKNTSNKKVFIFRADVDKRFQVRYSSKTILPDSTVYIRIWFSPEKDGFFNEKVPVHLSAFDVPQYIKIKGYSSKNNDNVKAVNGSVSQNYPLVLNQNNSPRIDCPDFSQAPPSNALSFRLNVKVIDKLSGAVLPKSDVTLVKNGKIVHQLTTNKQGSTSVNTDLGLYYFIVKKQGYNSVEFPRYVNRQKNTVVVALEKNQNTEEELSHIPKENTPVNTPPVKSDTSVIAPAPSVPATEKYPEFPLSKYKPNNIVFLIDVSTSMKYSGKLDLLKASMIEMTKLLRDIDNITIVTYASKTKVAMETMSADNKDSIINKIQSLEARGMTAGGRGLKLAYSKACESFINGGNNEIIMATDGDFNSGNENVYKLAKKYNGKGVKVSVIGIKNNREHERNMKKLATNGGGSYIKIDNFDDALIRLVEEIKQSSAL